MDSEISSRSVARLLSCLRTFYGFLLEEEAIRANPTVGIPAPKIGSLRKEDTMTDTELVREFLSSLKLERELSASTLERYERDLEKFRRFLAPGSLLEVTRDGIRSFVAGQIAEGLSSRSVARYLSCLRELYGFLVEEDLLKKNPTIGILLPKTWKVLPRRCQWRMWIRWWRPAATHPWDRAIILTLFAAGLRASELVSLQLQDVDLERSALRSAKECPGQNRAAESGGDCGHQGISRAQPEAYLCRRVSLLVCEPPAARNDPCELVVSGARHDQLIPPK